MVADKLTVIIVWNYTTSHNHTENLIWFIQSPAVVTMFYQRWIIRCFHVLFWMIVLHYCRLSSCSEWTRWQSYRRQTLQMQLMMIKSTPNAILMCTSMIKDMWSQGKQQLVTWIAFFNMIMHIPAHTSACVCAHTHMHTNKNTDIHTHTHTCTHTHKHMHTHMHTHMPTYKCRETHTHTCAHPHAYIHTCTHSHTHTHAHTHTH